MKLILSISMELKLNLSQFAGFPLPNTNTKATCNFTSFIRNKKPCRTRRLTITCIGWDPEGILGPPHGGHIRRREMQKNLALERQLEKESQERRRAARQARVVPDTAEGLVEYFLETEAYDIEYEIARCRRRLNQEFFEHLRDEMGTLRFAISRTKEMDDRLIELETLQKVLTEGIEAYDKMAEDLIGAKDRLARILQSKDKKAMLLEMMERNELDRSLLALLDENIVAAKNANQNDCHLDTGPSSIVHGKYSSRYSEIHDHMNCTLVS